MKESGAAGPARSPDSFGSQTSKSRKLSSCLPLSPIFGSPQPLATMEGHRSRSHSRGGHKRWGSAEAHRNPGAHLKEQNTSAADEHNHRVPTARRGKAIDRRGSGTHSALGANVRESQAGVREITPHHEFKATEPIFGNPQISARPLGDPHPTARSPPSTHMGGDTRPEKLFFSISVYTHKPNAGFA